MKRGRYYVHLTWYVRDGVDYMREYSNTILLCNTDFREGISIKDSKKAIGALIKNMNETMKENIRRAE